MKKSGNNSIAIDLTWVRVGKVGGTESAIRNLLDGFSKVESDYKFVLLASIDNAKSFEKYKSFNKFTIIICNVFSESKLRRLLWQNVKMNTLLKEMNIEICLEPIYSKPFFYNKGIKYITTIHDLLALHYPQYFSRFRVLWMKLSWLNAVKTSDYVIAISDYVRRDILEHFNIGEDKVKLIYNIVNIDEDNCSPVKELKKYGVKEKDYYYTISSLLPHKNLKTVIDALSVLKTKNSSAYKKLIISGVGGKEKGNLMTQIHENNMDNDICFTPFIDDSERNMLMKNCFAFLFPSIFEGFGMPPIEAMLLGVPVLTTKCTSIPEITQNKAEYVDNPFDENEWADKMEYISKITFKNIYFPGYEHISIAKEYIKLFQMV